jgi:hypothetical protein
MKALLALLSLVFATGAQAQSAKEKSELSAQCVKRATRDLSEVLGQWHLRN